MPTNYSLAFYPGGSTVGSHLELVFLGLICSTLWLAVGFLIVCCQVWLDRPNPIYTGLQSRGLGSAYIFVSFFIAALIWSRIPRLRPAMRVSMFVSTWQLTGSEPEISARNFTNLFYPILVTAILSALSNLLFPQTAYGSFFRTSSTALHTISKMVENVMDDLDHELSHWFDKLSTSRPVSNTQPLFKQSKAFMDMQRSLHGNVQKVQVLQAASQHELSLGRVPISSCGAIIPYLADVNTWMRSGFGLSQPNEDFELPIIQDVLDHLDEESPPCSAPHTQSTFERVSVVEVEGRRDFEHAVESFRVLRSSLLDALAMLEALMDTCSGKKKLYTREMATIFAYSLENVHSDDKQKLNDPQYLLAQMAHQLEVTKLHCLHELYGLLYKRGLTNPDFADLDAPNPSATIYTPPHSAAATPLAPTGIENLFRKPMVFRPEMYLLAQFSLSIFRLVDQTTDVLNNSKAIAQHLTENRLWNLHLPRMNFWKWLTSSSGVDILQPTSNSDFFTVFLQNYMHHSKANNDLHSDDEDEAGSARDVTSFVMDEGTTHTRYKTYAENIARASYHVRRQTKPTGFLQRIRLAWTNFTRAKFVLWCRIRLSLLLHDLKSSHHIHLALKLASGVTLFSMIAFLEPAKLSWWHNENGQWMIISYIWCLESTSGDMFRVSLCRFIGTILGAISGLIAYEISRGNVYGLCVLITVLEIPPSILRMHSSFPPPLGTVMGLTTPIVAIVPYLQPKWFGPVHVALVRSYMIILGIVAALLVNLIFWPYHARTKLLKKLSNTSLLLQYFYLGLARQMIEHGFKTTPEMSKNFKDMEGNIRYQLGQCQGLVGIMSNEFSLVPKPVAILNRIYSRLDSIFTLFVALRMCRETGLLQHHQEAVYDVLPLRQELVSTVLLDLWMLGQSLITHTRMPQFLPSTRRSLEELIAAIALSYGEILNEESMTTAAWRRTYDGPSVPQRTFKEPLNLDINGHPSSRKSNKTVEGTLYILAEHSILSQVVYSLEALLQLMRYMLGELRVVH